MKIIDMKLDLLVQLNCSKLNKRKLRSIVCMWTLELYEANSVTGLEVQNLGGIL